MAIPILTPLGALVAFLRACPVSGITWAPEQTDPSIGVEGSPYYDEVPEPAPAFPYVVIEADPSNPELSFEEGYDEKYTFTVYIVGIGTNIEALSTPYGLATTSVIAYLDSKINAPEAFDGDNFKCTGWLRTDWSLKRDEERDEAGNRVYVASAKYEMIVNATLP